jgi:hypothetical protein
VSSAKVHGESSKRPITDIRVDIDPLFGSEADGHRSTGARDFGVAAMVAGFFDNRSGYITDPWGTRIEIVQGAPLGPEVH